MKHKLEHYILNEKDRNINSDIAIIKKSIKSYIDKRKKLRASLYDEIGKKAISLSKSVTENEMENFKYEITIWMNGIGENDMGYNIESLIDAIIEKCYK